MDEVTVSILMQVIGWSGTALFIVAYIFLNQGRWTVQTTQYHIFNILGSILLVVNTVYDASWAAMFANLFWGLIAVYGLLKFRKKPAQEDVRG